MNTTCGSGLREGAEWFSLPSCGSAGSWQWSRPSLCRLSHCTSSSLDSWRCPWGAPRHLDLAADPFPRKQALPSQPCCSDLLGSTPVAPFLSELRDVVPQDHRRKSRSHCYFTPNPFCCDLCFCIFSSLFWKCGSLLLVFNAYIFFYNYKQITQWFNDWKLNISEY